MSSTVSPGPRLEGKGVVFNVRCGSVSDVRLVVAGAEPDEVPLRSAGSDLLSVDVAEAGVGTRYGYRIDGSDRVLHDPWARAVEGQWSVVVDESHDWKDDKRPSIPLDELVIYEMHVGGFTSHESSGVAHPGTFLGVIEKLDHLVELGINAVELLPVHQFITEDRLRALGLVNSWGYNTLGYFAPHAAYGTGEHPGCQVSEFKAMVAALHAAGIEVILDVVFNHTAEQDQKGPVLNFKGFESDIWYRQSDGRYVDWTGCGNTVDFTQPRVVEFTLECLRYWVEAMHVDGFRFDLAPILGRNDLGEFDADAPFFKAVAREPILNDAKLIAEPWDLHPSDGDCAGRFPLGWSEWNGRYRDASRRFVRGDENVMAEMGWRLTGSADVFHREWHRPSSGVNYVTCHDGFTLCDVASYEQKHNEANGEDNRDGHGENHSRNWGVEGPSEDLLVEESRRRHVANLIVTLLTSRGVPMLLAGDEMLRTQDGNNNAYCQDHLLAIDWSLLGKNHEFFSLAKDMIELRRSNPALRCPRFAEGDEHWVWPGSPSWNDPAAHCVAMRLDGSECPGMDGRPDTEFMIVYNFDDVEHRLSLPSGNWHLVIDTSGAASVESGDQLSVTPWSVAVLRG